MAIRWGIIGTSNISHDFVVAMNTLPRSEHSITSVASRNMARSEEFAKHFDIPKAYDSYVAIANDTDVGKSRDIRFPIKRRIDSEVVCHLSVGGSRIYT